MVMPLYVIRNYLVKPGVVGMAEGRREWKLQRRSLSVLLRSLAFIILLVKDNGSFKQGRGLSVSVAVWGNRWKKMTSMKQPNQLRVS